MGWNVLEWFEVAHVRDWWRAVVNAAMNCRVLSVLWLAVELLASQKWCLPFVSLILLLLFFLKKFAEANILLAYKRYPRSFHCQTSFLRPFPLLPLSCFTKLWTATDKKEALGILKRIPENPLKDRERLLLQAARKTHIPGWLFFEVELFVTEAWKKIR